MAAIIPKWIFIALIILPFPNLGHAEYRLFQLEISDSATKSTRSFVSNLDPDQYITYYHLRPTETIKYTSTWMCWGRTADFADYCMDPKKALQQQPQSPAANSQQP